MKNTKEEKKCIFILNKYFHVLNLKFVLDLILKMKNEMKNWILICKMLNHKVITF